MAEKRQKQRWEIADYYDGGKSSESAQFNVIDLNIDRPIGKLIDISSDGMKLQSDEKLEKGVIFKLKIDLPEEIKGSDQLIVDARSLWSEKIADREYFQTGFEFLSKFPHHDEIIELLFANDKIPQKNGNMASMH